MVSKLALSSSLFPETELCRGVHFESFLFNGGRSDPCPQGRALGDTCHAAGPLPSFSGSGSCFFFFSGVSSLSVWDLFRRMRSASLSRLSLSSSGEEVICARLFRFLAASFFLSLSLASSDAMARCRRLRSASCFLRLRILSATRALCCGEEANGPPPLVLGPADWGCGEGEAAPGSPRAMAGDEGDGRFCGLMGWDARVVLAASGVVAAGVEVVPGSEPSACAELDGRVSAELDFRDALKGTKAPWPWLFLNIYLCHVGMCRRTWPRQ